MICSYCMESVSKRASWSFWWIRMLAKHVWCWCGRCWVQTDKKMQSFFWIFRVAIDLHEESSFIAQAIFTNPLIRPFVFTFVCISAKLWVVAVLKITYSAGLGYHLYQGAWLMLPCRKITTRNRRIRRPWAARSIPILGPSPRNLVCVYTKVMMRFYVSICTYMASTVYRQPKLGATKSWDFGST